MEAFILTDNGEFCGVFSSPASVIHAFVAQGYEAAVTEYTNSTTLEISREVIVSGGKWKRHYDLDDYPIETLIRSVDKR